MKDSRNASVNASMTHKTLIVSDPPTATHSKGNKALANMLLEKETQIARLKSDNA